LSSSIAKISCSKSLFSKWTEKPSSRISRSTFSWWICLQELKSNFWCLKVRLTDGASPSFFFGLCVQTTSQNKDPFCDRVHISPQ
jgi:hypothetical protein